VHYFHADPFKCIELKGGFGTNVRLHQNSDEFTAQIDYIGATAVDSKKTNAVKPYAYVGVNAHIMDNSTISLDLGWQETDYNADAAQAGINYSYSW
jgi:hypothetical protein